MIKTVHEHFHRGGLLGTVAAVLVAAIGLWPASGVAADYFNGQQIYSQQCAECHGPRGRGIAAGTPDFTRGDGLMRSQPELFRAIAEGRGGMPAFDGILDESEILDVISYLRSLQR